MATTKTTKAKPGKAKPRKDKEGEGGSGGDSPIIVSGGGGTKRAKSGKYIEIRFDAADFPPTNDSDEHQNPNIHLRSLTIKGRPANWQMSPWIRIDCRTPANNYEEIRIKTRQLSVKFPHGDFYPINGGYRVDDWYIESINTTGNGVLYRVGPSTNCAVEINQRRRKKTLSKTAGSATKGRAKSAKGAAKKAGAKKRTQ